jgi:hypothetical protein
MPVFVPAQLHSVYLAYSGEAHIAYRRSSEVVNKQVRKAGCDACLAPRFMQFCFVDLESVNMKDAAASLDAPRTSPSERKLHRLNGFSRTRYRAS